MLANQVIQKTIEGLSPLMGEDIEVYSPGGTLLASTFHDNTDYSVIVKEFCVSAAESQVALSMQFLKVFEENRPEYVIVTKNNDKGTVIGKIAAFQISELMEAYKERFDKDDYIKNLLMDNLLLVDIYNRARKLGIDTDSKRAVMQICLPDEPENRELGIIRDILPVSENDFVTSVEENIIVIVKTLDKDETEENLEKLAAFIYDAIPESIREKAYISYGGIVPEMREVSRSYKEAIIAMEVGRIFFKESHIIAYSVLGIGRLVYQLPIPLCKMFISEIFKEKHPDEFDEEMLTTIDKFFENSLNVSETSRQLFIHRNTLVYRLEKLKKTTGLDLRVFEDAITFKIAMMVVDYMKTMEGDL